MLKVCRHFQRALVIFQRLGNQEAIGSVLNYIGINYQNQGNYDKAIEYCLQSLANTPKDSRSSRNSILSH